MQVGPTGLTFTATPTGEAEQITLRQEKPHRLIKSPFRLLNTTKREGLFGDYGFYPPTFKFDPNTTQKTTLPKCNAPREEIRRYIIKKFGLATWNYHPKEEFLNQKFNGKTLLHTSVKVGKLDISDLMLDYGADPDIEEDGQIIAHTAAAENNKLLIRILRYHKYKFAAYNSLGETPLMVAIAYGHEDVANYWWISSNVVKMAKDNSTVLHYAAKH
ncbi:hypothetical protein OUZ56_032822 [Daphnia magna]|uniref:Uncharacterized protein n=1 Tax=Daphnia magna TaxID=35525 RepID=A0ABR0B9K3_9CRUS|nr:hypothetical protein OUZ56_032822 [Daphnia magna]